MRSARYMAVIDRPFTERPARAVPMALSADAVTNGFEDARATALDYPVCLVDPVSCEPSQGPNGI